MHCSDPNCYEHDRHPGATLAKARMDIKRVGWSVVGILGTPSFAYTVGMTERRWPELYFALDVEGTPDTLTTACRLLNTLGHKLIEEKEPPRHQSTVVYTGADGTEWKCLLETRLHTKPLAVARKLYGSRFRVLEVDFVD